jgi:hypothetical protein
MLNHLTTGPKGKKDRQRGERERGRNIVEMRWDRKREI